MRREVESPCLRPVYARLSGLMILSTLALMVSLASYGAVKNLMAWSRSEPLAQWINSTRWINVPLTLTPIASERVLK